MVRPGAAVHRPSFYGWDVAGYGGRQQACNSQVLPVSQDMLTFFGNTSCHCRLSVIFYIVLIAIFPFTTYLICFIRQSRLTILWRGYCERTRFHGQQCCLDRDICSCESIWLRVTTFLDYNLSSSGCDFALRINITATVRSSKRIDVIKEIPDTLLLFGFKYVLVPRYKNMRLCTLVNMPQMIVYVQPNGLEVIHSK